MNLQEQIYRIQEMMFINEGRLQPLVNRYYEKIFHNLTLKQTDKELPQQMNWYNEEGKKVFERNTWGMFWIYDCDLYYELKTLGKYMAFDYNEFEKSLTNFLNEKYSSEFGEKPIKEIGNELCDSYDDI
jgi:hypothetical protein